MAKYRKKPKVIEALQNRGSWAEIMEWLKGLARGGVVFEPGGAPDIRRNNDGSLDIHTLEGTMRADVGDWIIRGLKGEFYPCKPDIFEESYEKVEE